MQCRSQMDPLVWRERDLRPRRLLVENDRALELVAVTTTGTGCHVNESIEKYRTAWDSRCHDATDGSLVSIEWSAPDGLPAIEGLLQTRVWTHHRERFKFRTLCDAML